VPGNTAGEGIAEQRRRTVIHEPRDAPEGRAHDAAVRANESARQDPDQVAVELGECRCRVAQLGIVEHQDVELAGCPHRGRMCLAGDQRDFAQRTAWADTIDQLLDAAGIVHEHFREPGHHDVHLAQEVALGNDPCARWEAPPLQTIEQRGKRLTR
jgi:hypothetical protein